jgi:hypothetical protein
MKVEVSKDQIYERKADDSGRISLPSKEFAGKKLEVIVTDVVDEDGNEG